ncbi:hypothetical protein EVAR_68612_1 [Eumeta japonica]|uniref:Uncharacterized protein n=1 Tax=Eumeta variegata TaxID=151549 RepID=A0A4C1ZMP6_EUMVA|nr:hypothetical protein EVAR_68612_1 [Eumeta japonica]
MQTAGTAATSEVQSALVRPPPSLIGRRSVRCATRLPCCRQWGACPDIVGTITLIVNRCFGGPLADRIDHSDEGQKKKKEGRTAAH